MAGSTNISMEDVSNVSGNMEVEGSRDGTWLGSMWRWSFRQVRAAWRWGFPARVPHTPNTVDSSTGDQGTWEPNRTHPTNTRDYWEHWENFTRDQELDKPQQPKQDTRFKVLEVDLRRLHNEFDHHTFRYQSENLVLRRGQAFTIYVKVDKPFTRGQDDIKIQLVTGDWPRESRNTMFLITPGESVEPTRASAVIEYVEKDGEGSNIRLSVALPADAPVGRYTTCVRLLNKDDKEAGNNLRYAKHKLQDPIIVLFNPWCKEDTVYLESEADRDEYVLNQSGMIYVGGSWNPKGRSWIFGQFDKDSLEAALYILDSSTLPYEAYGNPVRVSRCLSAMVNSNDDGGILTGNWSGNYEGGTSPTAWNGSVRILEEYMKTKQPVKYGQCWVFSGVTTTVCRALGIPARSVTNFSSAHDTDMSMTIDKHVDETGEPISGMDDSVWNFHVWNEGWFQRPDLPDGNDGWQAFDATPQEQSDNIMQCGPAPVAAVKAGNVHLGYDTKFIFGEVNGDSITWEISPLEERRVISVDTDNVGKKISTKAVGKRERLDLTANYKYDEGSAQERCVARIVSQLSSRRRSLQKYYCGKDKQDVFMTFDGGVTPKADVNVTFKAKNSCGEARSVKAKVTLVARYYTGADGATIEKKTADFQLSPSKEDEFTFTLKAADWLNKVEEDATIGVYAVGKVQETGQTFIHTDSYVIDKPDLLLKVKDKRVKVNTAFDIAIEVMNPLDIPLTNCSFLVEGAGIPSQRKIQIAGEIAPGQCLEKTISLTPKMIGEREVIASFNSRQLTSIFGTVDIEVFE